MPIAFREQKRRDEMCDRNSETAIRFRVKSCIQGLKKRWFFESLQELLDHVFLSGTGIPVNYFCLPVELDLGST